MYPTNQLDSDKIFQVQPMASQGDKKEKSTNKAFMEDTHQDYK